MIAGDKLRVGSGELLERYAESGIKVKRKSKQGKCKVNSSGQECPLHMSITSWDGWRGSVETFQRLLVQRRGW